MKTRLLIIIGIITLFTFAFDDTAYGLWIPQSPEELMEQSQVIFVGNITSVNVLELEKSSTYITSKDGIDQEIVENYIQNLDEYTVDVEEFVKNPLDLNEITVRQPTISLPGRVLPHGGFEIGDRVLLYIEDFDGINTYSKESFLIPEQCDASTVVHKPRMIGGDFKMMQYGMEKQDNFTANSPITFIAQSDMGTLFGASLEYDVYISKQVGKIYKDIVFHEKITADAKPCEWLSTAKWELIPDSGKYLVNGRIYKEGSNSPIGNKQFSVLPQSPLKQYISGVPFNEILCKEDLELIQKYDGSPACVTPETKQKLVERGWALEDPCPISYMDKDNAKTVRIPSRMDQFGLAYDKQVETFEQAKNLIGIEDVSLPQYIPDCLLNQTIWVSDTDTFTKKFVMIYLLDKNLDSTRNTLHEYEDDGLTIVYRDVVKGEPYQRMKKIDEGFYLDLIPRNPENYGGAEIRAVIDDTWIQLKSKILDLPELEKIVYSIPR